MRKAFARAALCPRSRWPWRPAGQRRCALRERGAGRADDHGVPAASGATVAVASSKLGDILVDAHGRTLYAFTKDKGDQSACSGECATNWPALTGAATAGTGAQAALVSTAMQADGSSQVTYGGKPLYHFAGDTKAGDTNGQGVGSVWFAVTADGQLVKEEATGGYP